MTTRRGVFASLLALLPWNRMKAKELPISTDILKSFDARDWAKNFVSIATNNPSIPFDEGTMTGWFANALMRGWDEHHSRHSAKASDVTNVSTWADNWFDLPWEHHTKENLATMFARAYIAGWDDSHLSGRPNTTTMDLLRSELRV